MCWNAQISFGTFYFALSTILLMYFMGRYPVSWLWFLVVFASVQAAEGMYWKKWISARNASRLIAVLLGLQLILLAVRFRPPYWLVSVGFASLFIMVALALTWRSGVAVASNGHLEWPVTTFPVLVVFWTILYFYGPVMVRSWSFLAFNGLLYLVCLYSYARYGTFGSMWCWVSNMVFLWYTVELLFLQPIRC